MSPAADLADLVAGIRNRYLGIAAELAARDAHTSGFVLGQQRIVDDVIERLGDLAAVLRPLPPDGSWAARFRRRRIVNYLCRGLTDDQLRQMIELAGLLHAQAVADLDRLQAEERYPA